MDFIRFAIDNPVKVAVSVLLLILAGVLALTAIPIQLTPDVDAPIVTVKTLWVGRSPEEVERQIIEEQEDKLKGVTNLKKMTATASQGEGSIELEFYIGTDMARALREVSDKLREVPEYPDDVDQPVITAAQSGGSNAMAWIVLTSDDPDYDVQGFYDTADKRLKPQLERVPGVGEVNIYGGREHQAHIRVNPVELAQRGISFGQLVTALRGENVNVSAGEVSDGRLDVRVRTVGQFERLDQVRDTIVAHDEQAGPIRVSDLATVELTLEKRRSFVRSKGRSALAFQIVQETGSNVMSAMAQLRDRLRHINERELPHLGPGLKMTQVYDETVYIDDAIGLVQNNLWVGGSLAVIVLLMFLRVVRPTFIIALSIPISVIGTFVVMTLLGRNINVISLAGLAFAVGMVVDNAIVVLENVDRHLGLGRTPREAALIAAGEVWGAVLASTLTTVAVFAPVILMQEEAGQLFRDISVAVVASVSLSLIVSITVIPSAAAHLLKPRHHDPDHHSHRWRELFGLAAWPARQVDRLAAVVHALSRPAAVAVVARLLIVGFFTVASIVGSVLLMPPKSYLPTGNQNLVFGMMINPPAYTLDHRLRLGREIEARIRPYWEARSQAQVDELPPAMKLNFATGQVEPIRNLPPIENYFYVAFGGNAFMGAASGDKNNVKPLGDLLTSVMFAVPGSIGFAQQSSIFSRGLEGTNAIDVEISGNDLAELRRVTQALEGSLIGQFGPMAVRSQPQNFDLPGPELRVEIDKVRAAEMNVDTALIGLGVQALVDGAIVGDYRYEGDAIDLLLVRDKDDLALTPEALAAVPVAVNLPDEPAARRIVPLGSLATITRSTSPQEIRRIEQRRAFVLTVNAQGRPLEQAMDQISGVIEQMRAGGAIPADIQTDLAGTADKLTQVRTALLGDWSGSLTDKLLSLVKSRMFIALLVTYLLMAALFESYLYPLVILFTVPLATVGGFIGLAITHHFVPDQQLDTLTMLGFVILIGVVVNNAILLVHQALNYMRGIEVDQPLAYREAIRESVRTRVRPIFMTTLTSVAGMLPLVVWPGAGSELYRGLGSVVVGGLVVATLFTLIVIPLLFSLVLDVQSKLRPATFTAPSAAAA